MYSSRMRNACLFTVDLLGGCFRGEWVRECIILVVGWEASWMHPPLLPVNRMTHACEKHYLPHNSYAGDKNVHSVTEVILSL